MSDPLRVLAWPLRAKTGNPYNELLYSHLARLGVEAEAFAPARVVTGAYDVWHIHWPDGAFSRKPWPRAIFNMQTLLGLMSLARWRGVRLMWTAHNLGGHETRHPRLEAWFWHAFTKRLDGYISLSRSGVEAVEERFPALRGRPGFVVPHGHYRGRYPNGVAAAEARRRLGLQPGAAVAAFFGSIRPYKNVRRLVEVFHQMESGGLMEGEGAALVVAGQPQTPALGRAIRAAAEGAAGVRLHLGFVPDAEVQRYLNAADLVVLPYTDILNSGSALLALSFNRPVLVPDRGAMGDLQAQVGPAWVRTYAGRLTPEALRDGLRWARQTARPPEAPLGALAWDAIARKTRAAYEAML